MHNRIKEIAQQAAEEVVDVPVDQVMITESESATIEIPDTFIAKFAELIVREAAKFTDHAEDLYKHFGVQEWMIN